MVWFPEHVLRWIGHSGSPMGTEGDSQKSHSTVVEAVVGGTKSVEKLGQTSQGKGSFGGSTGSAANHPGDAPVQQQGGGDHK